MSDHQDQKMNDQSPAELEGVNAATDADQKQPAPDRVPIKEEAGADPADRYKIVGGKFGFSIATEEDSAGPLPDPDHTWTNPPELLEAARRALEKNGIRIDEMTGIIEPTPQTRAKLEELHRLLNEEIKRAIAYVRAQVAESDPELAALIDEWTSIEPFLSAELEKPKYNGMTINELFDIAQADAGEQGRYAPDSLYVQALTAARAALKKTKNAKPPKVCRPMNVDFPVDKLNAEIFKLTEKDTAERVVLAMEAKRTRKGELKRNAKPLDLFYSIDFGEMEEAGVKISKRLTLYDKWVCLAVGALKNAGNDIFSLTDIFHAMGGTTANPSDNQLQKINESLTKMGRAWITVDDRQENEAYKYNIDECRSDNSGWHNGLYDGPFIMFDRISVKGIAGRTIDKAIHVYREPAVLTFARLKKQLTTIPVKLLQSPANKTEENLSIEDYLLRRIAKAKNIPGATKEKILLNTLYEKARIPKGKQRQRAPGKIKKYLTFYKEQGYITDFEIDATSATAYFPPKALRNDNKKGPAAQA